LSFDVVVKLQKLRHFVLMYKTAVYTLVNGVITNQNSKYQKKGDISQHYIDT